MQPSMPRSVVAAIAAAEKTLGKGGRMLVRKSGTEPLIRVMAEGDDSNLVHSVVDQIIEAIPRQAAMNGRVLIVAGSDSGGGAGIQADIKAVTAMNGFAATAITALTAQNTMGVHGVVPVDPAFIAQQIEVVLTDIGADALKTGMLHSAEVIDTVVAALQPARAWRAAGRRSGDGRQGRPSAAADRGRGGAARHGCCRWRRC